MPLDFTLTPEQEDIKGLAHEFAEKEIRPVAAHYDETEQVPRPGRKKATDVGLTPVSLMPEAYGGGGLDIISNMLIAEELHWGCAGIAVAITGTGLAAMAVLAMGNEAQKRRWIGDFCNAKTPVVGAMGLTEPGTGSDAMAIATTAKKVDGGYLINGAKQFITNGGIADLHVIFANTDPSAGAAGIAAFVVEKGNPGLTMGRKEKKLGVRASHTAQVILQDCFVPTENRLGGEPGDPDAGPSAAWPKPVLPTWRCRSRSTRCRCWAVTATSASTRSRNGCATPRSTRSGKAPPRSSGSSFRGRSPAIGVRSPGSSPSRRFGRQAEP